ncbi:MAG: hypothetical protein IJH87_02435, partial [Atopobiaceae bacterium]|nr:hypothetical protein [Atopobiaceae bacterium]
MKGVYLLELFRTIRSSLGRFVAIFGIVALGCGFFAGLMMCGLDMRSAADAFYDGTALYDIRVVSTMGITDEQIRLIEGVEGVESISGAYALDTMGSLGDEQVVFRITSFDPNVASRAVVDDAGITVASDDASYLNRLILTEGRWPERPNECVASAFRTGSTVANVGDTIDILYGTSDLDGVLDVRRYRIVGLVFSPTFVSNSDLGYTNLGSGIVQQYLYVLESAFAEELPYTEVYLSVSGAADEVSYSDGYQRIVDEVADRLELRSGDIAASRLAQVKADAQAELDDARDEFENEKRDAEAQLADARAQLEEAERELAAAQARIDSGRADLDAGRAELARSRRQAYDAMEAARRKLEDAERQLDEGEAELGMTQADIDAARAELEDGKAELAEGEEQLAQAEEEWVPIREGLVEVLANTTDVDTAMQALRDLLESEDMSSEEVLQAAEAATRAGSAAASALAEYDGLDEEQAATLRRAAVGLRIAAEIISQVDPETFDPADPAQVDALINTIEQ